MTPELLAELLRPVVLAADSTGLGGAGAWLNFGAMGLLAFVLFLGYRALLSFAQGAYQRERDRADRLAEELRVLNTELRDRYVPTMTEAVRVLGDVTALMRERR